MMSGPSKTGEKGIALVIAMAAALIVSLIAVAVLNMTFRQFELSAFRTSHGVAEQEAEAGLQYAFARLDRDVALRTNVQNKMAGGQHVDYVITGDPNVPAGQRDEWTNALQAGSKFITVRIRFEDNPPASGQPYRVRASADFGT